MTNKELRRLSRMELIQLLLGQAKELERVRQELEDAQEALNDRQIQIRKAGSIAEASLQINQVMEAAQRAADQYVENIKREYENRAKQQYDEIQAQLQKQKEAVKAECDAMLEEARRKADSNGTGGE